MLANYIDTSEIPNNLSVDSNRSVAWKQTYDLEPISAKMPSNIFVLIINTGDKYQINMGNSGNIDNESATVIVKEMVEKIRSIFGLNAIQVASIIGISRPSLYNHISDKESPKDLTPYKTMYDLAIRVEKDVSGDLKRGLKTVLVEGKTLLQHLKQKPIDMDQIMVVARQVNEKISSSEKIAPDLNIYEQRMKSRNITKSG